MLDQQFAVEALRATLFLGVALRVVFRAVVLRTGDLLVVVLRAVVLRTGDFLAVALRDPVFLVAAVLLVRVVRLVVFFVRLGIISPPLNRVL